MFETLFGEGQYALKFVIAFVGVLALIGLTVWLIRRFGAERLGTGAVRGRQPRLAVIDAASVDGRRRLVLIRRDNVEHLMMIGGPTDVVVEANIVRAAAPGREPQAPRPPAAADTLPRAVPLGEDNMWPLQPEPAPAPAPAPRAACRAAAAAAGAPAATLAAATHDGRRTAGLGAASPKSRRRHRLRHRKLAPQRRPARAGADPLAGLADEISRGQPPQAEAGGRVRSHAPVRRESRMPRRAVRHAAGSTLASRRHRRRPPNRSSIRPPIRTSPRWPTGSKRRCAVRASRSPLPNRRRESRPRLRPGPTKTRTTTRHRHRRSGRPPRRQGRPATNRDRRAPTRAVPPKSSLYDSLEQEMASLLGRPNGKN